MGHIRNVSGEPLYLPGVGTLEDQEVGEVPDDRVYAYTASANFEPVGAESSGLHEEAAAAEAERVEADRLERGIATSPVLGEPEPAPAGNASRDAWVAFALQQDPLLDELDLEALTRDQLRDKFGG